MNRTTTTIAGAAAALAAGPALAGATASHEPAVPVAASYAELLTPIPNAVERLRQADAEPAPARVIEAQYNERRHHHHHHHHTRAWYLRNGYIFQRGAWILAPRPHHHHHHHHHSQDRR